MKNIELSIILPVHNEEDIVENVFKDIYKEIKKDVNSVEFILVENGSTDGSLKAVKKICGKYTQTRFAIASKGYGSAVLKGLEIAKGDYVCYMPSDGQIDLSVFAKLWSEAKSGKSDVVKIKRANRENIGRTIVSKSFSIILSILFGTPQIDVNGSPRIFKKELLKELKLKSKDSFIDGEFLIAAKKLELSIKEFPAKNLPRAGGESTRSIKTFTEFFLNIYKFRFQN